MSSKIRISLIAVLAAGLCGWLYFLNFGDASRAWRALLVNFAFFAPMAAAVVVWPAIITCSQGRWAKPLYPAAFGAMSFAPLSIAALVCLAIGPTYWQWAQHHKDIHIWVNHNFIFCRDLAALLIFWIAAALSVKKITLGRGSIASGWLCFIYGIVFALIGFDLIMSLEPRWFSSLFGWYFFVSALYAGVAAWTISAICSNVAERHLLHDLGKLVVAMSLVTTYMMFSQLLPIWYENLHIETSFILPRLSAKWRVISLGLLATIYLGPLILLLMRRAKRCPRILMSVCLLVLIGLWLERWWLITPSLKGDLRLGLVEMSLSIAFAAAFVLCMSSRPYSFVAIDPHLHSESEAHHD